MATEYGFQAMPSVHAWREAANINDPEDWTYDSQLLANRQHHPLGNMEMLLQVESRLGSPWNATAQQYFLDMIYLTQVSNGTKRQLEPWMNSVGFLL